MHIPMHILGKKLKEYNVSKNCCLCILGSIPFKNHDFLSIMLIQASVRAAMLQVYESRMQNRNLARVQNKRKGTVRKSQSFYIYRYRNLLEELEF